MGKSVMGCWSRFSGHTTSTLHTLLLALFTPLPTFWCHPGMKEIKQHAAVPRGSCHTDLSTVAITITFHLARWPPVEVSQPGATDMDSGLCSLLNACHRVTITHRHIDTTDSTMYSLAPILPMFDVRCVNRPNSRT